MTEQSKYWKNLVIHIVVGVIAAIICYIGISYAPGTTIDSLIYIDAAEHLSSGEGIYTSGPNGEDMPLTHFPPMFPFILGLLKLTGLSVLSAAGWLNVILAGVNTFLVARLMRSIAPFKAYPAIIAAVLFAISPVTTYVHTKVWSEPLFITFMLITFLFFKRYFDRSKVIDLVFAGIFSGLAVLTRYAGLPIILSGFIVMMIVHPEPFKKRLRLGLIYSLSGIAILAIWLQRNMFSTGSLTDRKMVYHPVSSSHIENAMHTMRQWVLPGDLPAAEWKEWTFVAVVILIVVSIVSFSIKKSRLNEIIKSYPIQAFLACFSIAYPAFLVWSISFADYIIPLDDRMLFPFYVSVLILVLWLIHKRYTDFNRPASMRYIVGSIILIYAGLSGFSTYKSVKKMKNEGFGLTSIFWGNQMQFSKAIPENVNVYSNFYEAVNFHTDYTAKMIPLKVDPHTNLPNENYSKEMQEIKKEFTFGRSVFVWVSNGATSNYLPSKEEVADKLDLVPVKESEYWAVFKMR